MSLQAGSSTACPPEDYQQSSHHNHHHQQNNHQTSVYAFSENELETVLNMFQAPTGQPEVERGYGFLHDHAQQLPGPAYYQPSYLRSSPYGSPEVASVNAPNQHGHGQHATAYYPSAPSAYIQQHNPAPSYANASAAKKKAGGAKAKAVSRGGGIPQGGIPNQFLPAKKKSSAKGGAGKNGQVSHSVAEKQRRDRINLLIDELRELVPIDVENEGNESYAEAPGKRPKHVVLRDAIKFVKMTLQQQQQQSAVQVKTKESQESRAVARQSRSLSEDSASQDSETFDTCDLQKGKLEISVTETEESTDVYAVNVSGKDRNGLLHDITRALRSMDLEIKTAVISTETCGAVSDTFEVNKAFCSLSVKEIEDQLGETLRCEIKRTKTTLDEGEKRKRPGL
ncbi:helix-loop-helix DNA-binding domain-containing protein [Chloropicon primus]|uniref:BHLH domain-containing protein n=1 Tax=Chloropicon primus TaxID=1764295 RepID=A0A5B8MV51_9CHLO|nr:hypothetical protein A3770_13p69710 [Chloropicon primus]UPR03662.1 helix-loop-helix DNA-binding domain-containing protein [Chloropicon primus]|mmetsp:Transcript_9050/g.25773  ORF Transcript_9050/g.25773 Transcript_9050/m.25773 type:complete len:396 (+) Transcript_9050:481-1668(+)|eukprot:QDZ24453.1 hypothetical protein A3770_13p69710 [Chloropicon primus]